MAPRPLPPQLTNATPANTVPTMPPRPAAPPTCQPALPARQPAPPTRSTAGPSRARFTPQQRRAINSAHSATSDIELADLNAPRVTRLVAFNDNPLRTLPADAVLKIIEYAVDLNVEDFAFSVETFFRYGQYSKADLTLPPIPATQTFKNVGNLMSVDKTVFGHVQQVLKGLYKEAEMGVQKGNLRVIEGVKKREREEKGKKRSSVIGRVEAEVKNAVCSAGKSHCETVYDWCVICEGHRKIEMERNVMALAKALMMRLEVPKRGTGRGGSAFVGRAL